MSYFTKEIYECKRAFAENRMRENAKVTSLTEKQHDALASLCEIRHYIHSTDRMRLFNSESYEYNQMNRYLEELYEGCLLEPVGLPKLETIDYTELPDSNNWYYVLTETERNLYGDNFHVWIEEGSDYYDFCDMIEKFNSDVEKYLKEIDNKYGTKYCPTGMTRV